MGEIVIGREGRCQVEKKLSGGREEGFLLTVFVRKGKLY